MKEDTDFFKVLINAIKNDSCEKFNDPIYLSVMKDPVVLSSGVIMDRSSILNEAGTINFKLCPFTRQKLENEVFPLNYLKNQIVDWNKKKFQSAINLCQEYKSNRD